MREEEQNTTQIKIAIQRCKIMPTNGLAKDAKWMRLLREGYRRK